MAKRQVPHWQCPRSQALSISSAAWRRLASHAGRSLRERILLQVSLYAIRAKKSRGGPGRPRTRTARRRRNSQIANDSLGFSAPERSKRKHTSLGHFLCIRLPQKKQVFQAHWSAQRWPSNSAVSRRILRSDIITFDSRPRFSLANRGNYGTKVGPREAKTS